MLPKVRLRHKKSGKVAEVFPVDAREYMEGREWERAGDGEVPAPGAPQSTEDEERVSPLELIPGLTKAGAEALRSFGIQTCEELGRTPRHLLAVRFDPAENKESALDFEDWEPIAAYLDGAEHLASNRAAAGAGQRPAKPRKGGVMVGVGA
jgi:hypothetical protein